MCAMYPPSRMGAHTRISGVLSYAAPSIANISSHAALAAAKGQNYNIGAKFTVTVDAGGETVREVPFVNKEGRGFQMNSDFWKVSPL